MSINMTPIKNRLELLTCPDHQQHPTVVMEVGTIEITACCEPFRLGIETLANQEYAKVLDASLVDVLDEAKHQAHLL